MCYQATSYLLVASQFLEIRPKSQTTVYSSMRLDMALRSVETGDVINWLPKHLLEWCKRPEVVGPCV